MAPSDIYTLCQEFYTAAFCGILFSWYVFSLLKKRFAGAWWVMAAAYAAARYLTGQLPVPEEPDGSLGLLRTLLIFGLSLVLCAVCCRIRPRIMIYICVSWQAIYILAFFISYTVVLAAGPLFDYLSDALMPMIETDADGYISRILMVAYFFNLLMTVCLTFISIFAVRRIVRFFPRTRADLSAPAFRLMVLPAVTGFSLWMLVRPILFIVSDGVPLFLYDLYPPLIAILPVLSAAAGFGIVNAVRACREMMDLEGERSSRVIAETQLQSLRDMMQDSERRNAQVARMRHDLKNTLTVIQALSENIPEGQALRKYLTALNGEMEALERPFCCGDPVADTLLAAKQQELQTQVPDARLEAQEFVLGPLGEISSYDLGVLLGNALDNAIRAVKRQEEGPRFIRLRTYRHGDLLGIVVANSCDGTVPGVTDGLPESTKTGTDHGFGLPNIRGIAARYGGTMDWKMEDGTFTLSVLLSGRKKRAQNAEN